jgi:hypothetical protein
MGTASLRPPDGRGERRQAVAVEADRPAWRIIREQTELDHLSAAARALKSSRPRLAESDEIETTGFESVRQFINRDAAMAIPKAPGLPGLPYSIQSFSD